MKLDSNFFPSVFVRIIEWNDVLPNLCKRFYVVWVIKPLKKVANGGSTYVPICIQQDATLHSLLYLETVLHVSGGTSTHHQERMQLYLQRLVFVTPLSGRPAGSSNG
jgi:hypothetical protein